MNPDEAMEVEMILWNHSPQADLLELTPAQVHTLLYEPYSTDAVLQMATQIPEEVLDAMPMFRMAETFLAIIQRNEFVKLTATGALPKSIVIELYSTGFLPEILIESGLYKLSNEAGCIGIQTARHLCVLAGFVRKEKGKLFLTNAAKKYLADGNRVKLFHQLFRAFTDKYSWGYHDGCPAELVEQLGWAFSVYALLLYGKSPRPASFYAKKYLRAFPDTLAFLDKRIRATQASFSACFETRLLQRFLVLFGLVQRTDIGPGKWFQPGEYSSTPQLARIFTRNVS